jgi:hypothetical protein
MCQSVESSCAMHVQVCGIQVCVCRVYGIQLCVCRSAESSCACAGSVESKCACAGSVESKCACATRSVESKCANPKARELNCGTQERLCPSVWARAKSKRTCAGAVFTKIVPVRGIHSIVRVRVCGAQYQCACGSVELSISAREGLWSSVS